MAPVAEPVTIEELRAQCSITHSEHDTLLTAIGQASREWLESVCGLALLPQTLVQSQADFPRPTTYASRFVGELRLLRGPVTAVEWVKYLDSNDADTTLPEAVYRLETNTDPAMLLLKAGQLWPDDVGVMPGSVRVRYVAGYANAAAVPAMAKHAIKLLAAHFFANREANISGTIIAELPRGLRDLVVQLRGYSLH